MKIRFKGKKTIGEEVKRIEPEVVVGEDASPKNNINLLKKLLKGWEKSLKQLKGNLSIGEKQKRCYLLVEIAAHRARIRILKGA